MMSAYKQTPCPFFAGRNDRSRILPRPQVHGPGKETDEPCRESYTCTPTCTQKYLIFILLMNLIILFSSNSRIVFLIYLHTLIQGNTSLESQLGISQFGWYYHLVVEAPHAGKEVLGLADPVRIDHVCLKPNTY